MRRRALTKPSRHWAGSGQAMVEFAIVASILLPLLMGIIGFSWVAFQTSSVSEAARAAARVAAIKTPLITSTEAACGGTGEATTSTIPNYTPPMIVQVVTSSTILGVNQAPLCDPSGSGTTLTQGALQPGVINITVVATPSLSAPTSVTVQLTYTGKGLGGMFNSAYPLKAQSTVEVISTF